MSQNESLHLPLPELAEQFFLLRRDVTFLNHGSFGACPRPVFERYQAWQRELEAEPVDFLGRRINGLLEEARTAFGEFIGAQPRDVVFVPNVTYAVNIVARSLDLQPGDEVLGTNHEYGAVERTWRFVCGQRGARYVTQPVNLPLERPEDVVEQLWAGVTERTRVIAMSHITSPTALIFPIAEICRRAREAGILTVIDGAHAAGQIDLDMDAIGADFYGGNCHKWLCAPKGAGFLYARPEQQAMLEPLVVSWGWQSRTPSDSPFLDLFQWMGTDDPSAFLSVPAAIAFQQANNWPAVRAACHELASEARRQVAELTGVPPVCPDSPEWFGQMCILPLSQKLHGIQQRLWDEYQIEIPETDWNGQHFLRISIQAYNTPADVERLVGALQNLS
ncbi:MAG TPA: aminotransferase class V-fold PLP-dependent enzyme [Roseiflexaceae bacterium]|nr:aminotransferase class V-fold PLP-dependent enzyme [Roseiflexaceae bacterium]